MACRSGACGVRTSTWETSLGRAVPRSSSPPARLTGNFIRVYRLDKGEDDKWRWHLANVTFDNAEHIQAAYGAATLADMDGDGKLDIVFGRTRLWTRDRVQQGGGAFKVETLGLPRRCRRVRSPSETSTATAGRTFSPSPTIPSGCSPPASRTPTRAATTCGGTTSGPS